VGGTSPPDDHQGDFFGRLWSLDVLLLLSLITIYTRRRGILLLVMDHKLASNSRMSSVNYGYGMGTFDVSVGDSARKREWRVDSAEMYWRDRDVISGEMMSRSRRFERSKDVVSIACSHFSSLKMTPLFKFQGLCRVLIRVSFKV
jgi:hypothetical protein